MSKKKVKRISRRSFLEKSGAASLFLLFPPWMGRLQADPDAQSRIFQVTRIPSLPFTLGGNMHAGVDTLLSLLGSQGLKFFRSVQSSELAGPEGIIAANDVVLIKVNAQWKYRGCTNSDVVRGLIQRILDHPDGFSGEVVIIENGQGRGSLNCDTSASYGNSEVHANAVNEQHSFLYLVNQIFSDPRVSAFQLDPIRTVFINAGDHQTNGYRRYENVSYPCFTSSGGRRIELREGVWTGSGYSQNLKLINMPVLKHHDNGGSEITAALKHVYGLVSMADGNSPFRHYAGLGETCGKMMVSVRPPVLNIVDAIWVSHKAITGFPATSTEQANVLLAAQDPVALDYWAAKNVLYPIDQNPRHHPDHENIQRWLAAAEAIINQRGGLYHPEWGIMAGLVTRDESRMVLYSAEVGEPDRLELTSPNGAESWLLGSSKQITWDYLGLSGNVRLVLFRNNVKVGMITSVPVAQKYYNWVAGAYSGGTAVAGDNYRIKVVTVDGVYRDSSDANFTLNLTPFVQVVSPNGGESWARGSSKEITWNCGGVTGNVRLVLFSGNTKVGTIAIVVASQKNYNWTVGNYIGGSAPAGSNYRIKVVTTDNVYSDFSDSTFAITNTGGGLLAP